MFGEKIKSTQKSGFTLIELLVVISIIGLLASVILGNIADARKKAFYAKAAGDARTTQIALQLYYDTNKAWPPSGANLITNTGIPSWTTLENLLKPYLPVLPRPGLQARPTQLYMYIRGSTALPIQVQTWDSTTNVISGCITVRDGYYLSYMQAQQSPLTLNDGGIDKDSIEMFEGDYTIKYVAC
jgi:prepilin-type N-terminal cleavage/methylation domain-containing protein